MDTAPDISIVLPCLNEAAALQTCLAEIREVLAARALRAEVIVVDNGSTDASAAIVAGCQESWPELILLTETRRGYGLACLKGLQAARSEYIFMADADGSYDWAAIPLFLEKLKSGFGLVVGNRFAGGMEAKAMPWLHRYLGNPVLSFLVRRLFRVRIGDIHCGARALSRAVLPPLNLHTGGMEFASEMVIKAAKSQVPIAEIPIRYRARLGQSKLRSWSDGWRHLRFILLYSPLVLFFLPGLLLFGVGLALMLTFYLWPLRLFGVQFYSHPFFLFSLMIISGYQLMLFGAFAKIYAITHLGDGDDLFEWLFRHLTLERTGLAGLALSGLGGIIYLSIFLRWVNSGFGPLSETREAVIGLTLLVFGLQTFFAAFMFSILGIKER